jgi:S1-C subfamily serine protease
VSLLSTAGCATIIEGTSQTINVATIPTHASCTLNRDGKTIGTIANTPGAVEVSKTRHDLLISCSKSGYQTADARDTSEVAGWLFGNLVLGGLIGIGIDATTGAAEKYDGHVQIALTQQRTFGVGVATLDSGSDHGLRVGVVLPGSAAANAGIAVGDILVSLDGEPLTRKGDIQRVLASRPEGSVVAVHLVRNGTPVDVATQL